METMQFDKMVEKCRQELLTMAAKQKNSQWPLSASEREAPQQPKISEDNIRKAMGTEAFSHSQYDASYYWGM